MALILNPIPALDPGLLTGPSRLISNVVGRSASVILDTPYGEFATSLYVGTAGNVSVVKWDGTTQQYDNMIAGTLYPICSLMINSAGTTASNIVWGS